jgi:hypothetical protein
LLITRTKRKNAERKARVMAETLKVQPLISLGHADLGTSVNNGNRKGRDALTPTLRALAFCLSVTALAYRLPTVRM